MLHIADGVLYLIQLLGTKTTYLKARDLSGIYSNYKFVEELYLPAAQQMWNGSPRFQGIECKVVHENMWKQECAQHEHVDEFCVSGVNPKPPTEDDRCFWQGEGHRCRDIETEPDLPEAIWDAPVYDMFLRHEDMHAASKHVLSQACKHILFEDEIQACVASRECFGST